MRAGLAVNREMVTLYWRTGRDILARQDGEDWGAKVIDRLSRDKYMRAFAEAWPDKAVVQGPLAQLTMKASI